LKQRDVRYGGKNKTSALLQADTEKEFLRNTWLMLTAVGNACIVAFLAIQALVILKAIANQSLP
ncbi:MAG TPA: hypothetical protein P5292_07040, partial [Bacteroidia bacterium]|nr:hypothetical protein [Bacteroidia bacterium]